MLLPASDFVDGVSPQLFSEEDWQQGGRGESPPTHPSEALLLLALPLTGCVILGEMLPSLGPSSLSIEWILNLGSSASPIWWGANVVYKEPCSEKQETWTLS